MTMTLEQVRNWLRRYAKNADNYFDRKRKALELTIADKMADAIDAHLTQPAQACEHDWAVGYGVPTYCNHCGVERDPKPAQSVDVAKVREVIESHINEAKKLRHDPESQDYLYEQADKLEAALQESKP